MKLFLILTFTISFCFSSVLFTKENKCVKDVSIFINNSLICFEYSAGGSTCINADMSDFIPMYVYKNGNCTPHFLMTKFGFTDPNFLNILLGASGILVAFFLFIGLP